MKSNVFKINRLKEQNYRNTGTHVNQRVGSYSDTDHKVDAVHAVIKDQLAYRIAQKSSNAGMSDRRAFFYYKRKTNGRRCSCYGDELSPDSDCGVCYGTGFVGGYDKYGTFTEVIDFTRAKIFTYNTRLDFDVKTIGFAGNTGSYIEFSMILPKNGKEIDAFYFGVDKQEAFNLEIISPFSKIIEVKDDLKDAMGIEVRARINFLQDDSYFQYLIIRTAVLNDITIYGDCANYISAPNSELFGEFETMQEIDITFTGMNMSVVSNKDIMYRLQDGAKLKITDNNRVIVSSVLTSINAKARFLISTDRIEKKLII